MSVRGLLSGVLSWWCVLAAAVSFCGMGQTAFALAPAEAETCSNASFRLTGPSADLPDCRAYELVTPVDKNGGDIVGDGRTNIASGSGDRLAFATRTGIADTEGSGGVALSQYIATRGTTSWSTHGITPTPALNAAQIFFGSTFNQGFSIDLTSSLVTGYALPEARGGIPNGVNLYREDTGTNRLETITMPLGTETIPPFAARLGASAYSADLGVVTFQSAANFLPQTSEGDASSKLYAWNHGRLELAGVLPDGSMPPGGSAAPVGRGFLRENKGSVSNDGSRILFVSPTDGSSPQQLYMRKDGSSTVWVSQSESSTPDPEPREVEYQTMSPDGREVVFSTSDRLLDSDPGGAGKALYRYTDSVNPEAESNLTFIARVQKEEGQEWLVPAMSEDGARIYFLSKEMAGFPVGRGEGGGSSQLYLWDHGTVHWVAGPIQEFQLQRVYEEVWVSADGRRLALASQKPLTGDSTEIRWSMYIYDEAGNTLRCISCSGAGAEHVSENGVELEPKATRAAAEPALPLPNRHVLSDDGRYVFFSTPDALVPQDTNGLTDAYVYDVDTGELSLLSPGTGDSGSWFVEASLSGRDAFFVTREPLSGWDVDKLADIYDARVDGGLPEPPPPPVACAGDACQGVPSAVPLFTTASGFSGLGNVLGKPATPVKERKAKSRKRHAKGKRHIRKRKQRAQNSQRKASSGAGR